MSYIKRKGIWRPQQVPTFPVEIDWSHPLAENLVGCWLPGLSLADLTRNSPPFAQQSGNAVYGTPWGPAFYGRATPLTLSGGPLLSGTKFSLFAPLVVAPNVSSSVSTPILGIGLSTPPYSAYYIGGQGYHEFYLSIGGAGSSLISVAQPSVHTLAATFGPSGGNLYLDGVFQNNTVGTVQFAGTPKLYLASYSGYTQYPLPLALIYNTDWGDTSSGTAQQPTWLSAEPFAMLRPKLRRRYYYAPGGGGGNVSVPLTGVAASGAAGSVTSEVGVSLIGAAATGEPGSVAPQIAPALTGAAATGAAGSVTGSISSSVTGVSASGVAGTLTSSLPVSLAGVAGSGTAGSVSAGSGTVTPAGGVAGLGAAGTLAASLFFSIAGVAGVGVAGSEAPTVTGQLGGVAGTAVAGALGIRSSITLPGVAGQGAVGSLGVYFSSSVTLLGGVGTGYAGIVVVPATVTLEGVHVEQEYLLLPTITGEYLFLPTITDEYLE